MSNQNNVPTAPGWWYKSNGAEEEEISCLFVTMYGHRLHYVRQGLLPVTDDGLWRGPVPMPGEWAWIGDARDICGLCGKPGADKVAHPMRWPGERSPDTQLVHAECESDECERAHAALSQEQRESFLRSI